MKTLSFAEARRVYDRIGGKQDTQAFYEDRATDELVPHLALESAGAVFEFGCGTGRFAEILLREHLPQTATYRGVDLSPVMIELASKRLAPFAPRAAARLTDGDARIAEPAGSCDRFLSNFVLDLLSDDDIRTVIDEAHRMLVPAGLLGLTSLTHGFTMPSRALGWLWAGVHALRPSIVGGCRALELLEFLPASQWDVRHHAQVAPFGIAMEAVVARRR